jgi:hypothetical protein
MRDRSAVITCVVAPLAVAAILGFAFAGNAATGTLPIGVSGAPPAPVRGAAHSPPCWGRSPCVPTRERCTLRGESAG